MKDRIEQASIVTKANVYFDGRCVSHTVYLADGSRKSVGVILPSTFTFETAAPEVMEIVAGRCRGAARRERIHEGLRPRRSASPSPPRAASGSRRSSRAPLRLPLRRGKRRALAPALRRRASAPAVANSNPRVRQAAGPEQLSPRSDRSALSRLPSGSRRVGERPDVQAAADACARRDRLVEGARAGRRGPIGHRGASSTRPTR